MIVPSNLQAEFSEVLATYLACDLALRYRAAAQPAVHLRLDTSEGDLQSGSRLGGYPVLPAGVPWPDCVDEQGGDRRLLVCMAVLDLAQLAPYSAITGLPCTGFLTFFYADDASSPPWGEDEQIGGWQVVYAPADTAPATKPTAPVTIWSPYTLIPEPAMSYPQHLGCYTLEELQIFTGCELSEDAYAEVQQALYDCADVWGKMLYQQGPFNRSGHQLGGIPAAVQDDPIGVADWRLSDGQSCGRRLLLQIDGDARITSQLQRSPLRGYNQWLGLDFTIYFIVDDADLRGRDFSNVLLIAQR